MRDEVVEGVDVAARHRVGDEPGSLGFGLGLALARLGVAEGRFAAAFGGEDLGLLVALGTQDLGRPIALGLEHGGAPNGNGGGHRPSQDQGPWGGGTAD